MGGNVFQSNTRKLLAVLGAAILAVVVAAPTASAAEPAEGYEKFAGCPSPEENPGVVLCTRAVISGGHFNMGNKEVPISNPITLSGGINQPGEMSANEKGGLTPVPQQVPGGIIGLTGLDWLVNFFDIEALQLFAVTELAGTPEISGANSVFLPLRVRLVNPLLGSNCYIGSFTEPINLDLTTQTTEPPPPNEPITGVQPELSQSTEPPGIFTFANGTFVENEFAAPGANGCEQHLFGFIPVDLDGLVNFASHLPSAAGTNETVQEFDLEIVDSDLVYP